ncbi:MAG: metallothionein [Chloroflexota bacterium]|nr:metallothionein [Chloroflexota bacterium]
MVEQLCPRCGCPIGQDGYELGGVTYCCEPCATGSGPCECGCCETPTEPEKEH